MAKKLGKNILIVGAGETHVEGPATLYHEGGDPVVVTTSLKGESQTLSFDGENEMVEIVEQNGHIKTEDVFKPYENALEIEGDAKLEAHGQANIRVKKHPAPKEKAAA